MKRAKLLMAAVIALACTAVSCGKSGTGLYEKEITARLNGEDDRVESKLSGMAADVCVPGEDSADTDFVEADYAALYDDTAEQVLYQKASTEKLYPASMTKMMTALVVLENCQDLDQLVYVSDEVKMAGLTTASSMANLQVGASYSVGDLLYALLVPSGNDAANVLAWYTGGSIEHFVEMMNAEAERLGMLDTHYMNPHGLHDAAHYTTAYDLYLLMHSCIQYQAFTDAASASEAEITAHLQDGTEAVQELVSGNSILKGYTDIPSGLTVMGAKTGYTQQAGRCLTLAVRGKNGHVYISVIGHAHGYDECFADTAELLTLTEQ